MRKSLRVIVFVHVYLGDLTFKIRVAIYGRLIVISTNGTSAARHESESSRWEAGMKAGSSEAMVTIIVEPLRTRARDTSRRSASGRAADLGADAGISILFFLCDIAP